VHPDFRTDEDDEKELVTDGGTDTSGTERSVYLAGPIEADDSPRSWRDELRDCYPEIDWIDPMDWQGEWEDDPSAIWQRELKTVRNTSVLVCNIGTEAPRTTGTHHEIREALNHGQDVAIVPEGDVSQIYREIEGTRTFEDREQAVQWLVRPEATIAADGGKGGSEACSVVFDRWIGKADANIAEWGLQSEETLLLAIQEELGELTQAYLEATHEDGHDGRVDEELDDLGALLLQLHEARNSRSLSPATDRDDTSMEGSN